MVEGLDKMEKEKVKTGSDVEEELSPEEEKEASGSHVFLIILVVVIILIVLYFVIAYFADLPPFANNKDPYMLMLPDAYFDLIPQNGSTKPITFYDNEGNEFNLTFQGQFEDMQKCKKLCFDDRKCGAFSYNQPGEVPNQCWFSDVASSVPIKGALNPVAGESWAGVKDYTERGEPDYLT